MGMSGADGVTTRLQIKTGQLFDFLQFDEKLFHFDENDDGHVANQHGARLLNDVDDFRLVDQLAYEVQQRQECRGSTQQNCESGFRSGASNE